MLFIKVISKYINCVTKFREWLFTDIKKYSANNNSLAKQT